MPRRGQSKPKPVIGDPTDPQGFCVMLARYLDWMRVKNYSDTTLRDRERNLSLFVLWCEERSITRPSEVTKPMLDRYARYLYYYRKDDGQPLSLGTQMSRLIPLRTFFKWLTRENLILYNPASELDLPRVEHRLPKHVLTAEEADLILNQPDLEDPLGIRDRAILETFYSSGVRRLELIRLRMYDLDVDRGTLIVRQGKGKKDRVIPIGERAIAWLDKYLIEIRPGLVVPPDKGHIFLTNDGHPFGKERLTQLVRGYVIQSGIAKRGSCHLFRHTMATLMLEGGADIRFIQQMLGHAKMETTQIYTQVSIRKLKEIHTATHPGARLGRQRESEDAGDAGS